MLINDDCHNSDAVQSVRRRRRGASRRRRRSGTAEDDRSQHVDQQNRCRNGHQSQAVGAALRTSPSRRNQPHSYRSYVSFLLELFLFHQFFSYSSLIDLLLLSFIMLISIADVEFIDFLCSALMYGIRTRFQTSFQWFLMILILDLMINWIRNRFKLNFNDS